VPEHIFPIPKSLIDTLCDNSRLVLQFMTPGNAFATALVTTSNRGISSFSYSIHPSPLSRGCNSRFPVPHW
jgi:hypothetical protein